MILQKSMRSSCLRDERESTRGRTESRDDFGG